VYKRDLNEGFRASFTDAAVSLDPFTLTLPLITPVLSKARLWVRTSKLYAAYCCSPSNNHGPERGIEWWRIRSVPPELWGIDTNQIWDDTPLEEVHDLLKDSSLLL
jgi:hypothetical protein